MIPWVRPSIMVASSEMEMKLGLLVKQRGFSCLRPVSLRPCNRSGILEGVSSIVREHRPYLVVFNPGYTCELIYDVCNVLPRDQLLHICLGIGELNYLLKALNRSYIEKIRGFIVMVSNTNEVVQALSFLEKLKVRGLLSKRLYLLLNGLESISFNEDILDYVIKMCSNYETEVILSGVSPGFIKAWGFRRGRTVPILGLKVEEYCRRDGKVYLVNGIDCENVIAFSIEEPKMLVSPRWISGVSIEYIPTCSYKMKVVKGIVRKMFMSRRTSIVSMSPSITLSCGGISVVIDELLIRFLKLIDEKGSMRAASERLHVPLTTLRKRIFSIEEVLGVRLIQTRRGGADKGGARLTKEGLSLIRAFESMKECFRREFGTRTE